MQTMPSLEAVTAYAEVKEVTLSPSSLRAPSPLQMPLEVPVWVFALGHDQKDALDHKEDGRRNTQEHEEGCQVRREVVGRLQAHGNTGDENRKNAQVNEADLGAQATA